MRFPWQRRIQMSEPLAACPGCGSTLPHLPLERLVSCVWRSGRVYTEITGHVLRCARCAEVFSVGPTGTFGAPGQAAGVVTQPKKERPEPPFTLPPVPREKPRV